MTELIEALRCEQYGDDECENAECPFWSELGCRNGVANRDAADALERLMAQVPAWISVEERLPEFHEEVLVYAIGKEDAFTPVMAVSEIYIFKLLPFSNGTIEWRNPWDYFNKNYKVTHWMPLPKAPDLT